MKLSKDVEIDEQVDFNTLLQNEQLLQGLSLSGYERPSPIQLKAIPIGRLGIDLIAQAKSGTGKTVVFGVIAIENVNISIQLPQVIMVAPTREIAVQIRDVVRSLAQLMPLKCEAIIGGLSVQADAQKLAGCQIIVGTPGRLLALLEDKKINTSQLKLWVMDEADKLMSDKLQSQVQAVFNKLPKTIQCIAFSATFTEELVADLSMFMKSPQQIRLTEGVPTLKEVQQYYVNIQEASSNLAVYRLKFEEAAKLLSKIPFYQCMIFVNNLPRSIELTDWLNEIGWKSGHISSSLTQDKRLSVMEQMRQFKLRVLVCSDLVARGIDIDRVNLVINLDMPWEVETYLHRVGRTGRYGTSGIAVNLIGPEDVTFLKVLEERKIQIRPLPDKVSYSEYIKELSAEEQDSLKKYQSVNIEAKPFKHKWKQPKSM
ncbi:hypothetical protein G6F62_011342 [Rhizopus arrhizus]|nr:hypothetical protein G6F62_011342 [Rhizopus arrhizus]